MLMDLTCPAEFVSVEVLRDSSGRAQAYLTFRNLSDATLSELAAMVTMLDAQNISLGMCPLRYRRLQVQPHSPFTLCMVLDDLPFFENARVTIQRIGFDQGDPWEWDEDALMDCTPKPLAPGPQRVALIAIAGADAVCWPERRKDTWVCVCGRFNLRAWRTCRRCHRNREETFARYELSAVMAEYQERRNAEDAAERFEIETAQRRAHSNATNRQLEFGHRLRMVRVKRWAFWMVVVAVVLIACSAFSTFRSLPSSSPFR